MGEYVITAGVSNNGILGKSDVEAKVYKSKTITVDMFGYAFYRSFNYKMVTHARVFSLTPKNKITENQGMFLEGSLSYLKKLFGYENMCSFAKIKNLTTILPTKNGKIDFEFMETFVAELEAQRVAELEAQRVAELKNYLEVSGLDNYELSNKELEVLESYDSVEWGEYNYLELFELKSSDKLLTKKLLAKTGKYPTFSSDSANNGIVGYSNISPSFICDEENPIFIIFGDHTRTFNIARNNFNVMDNVKVLRPIRKLKLSEVLFITSSWKKGIRDLGYSRHWKIAKEVKFLLPKKNNQIDFDFMETYISAITKLAIKDVVKYADKRIAATKKIVNKQ